jgi:hypothetical protein
VGNPPVTSVHVRFNKVGVSMPSEDDTGDVLEDVARIHRVVDRLRELVASATLLDLKASGQTYWARQNEAERSLPEAKTA